MEGGDIFDATLNQTNVGANNNKFCECRLQRSGGSLRALSGHPSADVLQVLQTDDGRGVCVQRFPRARAARARTYLCAVLHILPVGARGCCGPAVVLRAAERHNGRGCVLCGRGLWCTTHYERYQDVFKSKFIDKTKNAWEARRSFQTVKGKYTLLEMDYGCARRWSGAGWVCGCAGGGGEE